MAEDFTLRLRRFKPTDRRMGRHVGQDSRSRRFPFRASDPATLQSIRHHVNIPILDQLDEGSCTGHGSFAAVCSDPFWHDTKKVLARADDAHEAHLYARGIYSDATKIDPWLGEFEPADTGSGARGLAKELKARGT